MALQPSPHRQLAATMPVRRYLQVSLLVALLVVALKLAAWRMTGSVGLLSDAMESVVNVVAAAFALAMVSIAVRPPDAGHPFGHSKAEYFSSGVEGLVVGVAALSIAFEALQRLLAPRPVGAVPGGIALVAIATALNWGAARWMLGGARRARSIALEADARHLMTDVWTSVAVVAGVLLVPLTGRLWIDPLVACAVAAHIGYTAWQLLRRSVDGLMDRALSAQEIAALERVLDAFRNAEVRFDHVRTRRAAARCFVSMHMHLPAHWTLGHAARRRQAVERALMAGVPGIGVTIETLPQGEESAQDDDGRSETASQLGELES
jgi:cation diffusion facilitator family transporter